MDDAQLMLDYVKTGSDRAFAGLVNQHVDLVYSAALRQVRDRHAAEDVAQAVFLALAKQAGGLRKEAVLSAWLLTTTRHISLDLLKARRRRHYHEMKAAQMAKDADHSEAAAIWGAIEPHLDEALASLGTADRRLISLRYFENQSFDEVARRLELTPAAARQRAHRAIERMRSHFTRLGIEVPLAALGPSIILHAIAQAPPEVASAAARMALANALSAGISGTKGAVLLMASLKLKILVAAAVLLMLAGGAAVAWKGAAGRNRVIEAAGNGAPGDTTSVAWRGGFDRTYGLHSGEVLALVSPPYIPERQLFWQSQNRSGPVGVLQPNEGLTIAWTSAPRLVSMSYVNKASNSINNTLRQALAAANITPREIDGSVPTQLTFAGDWVFQQGATADQIMAALGPIVSARLGHPVHFEKRRVTGDIAAAHGPNSDHPTRTSDQWCMRDGTSGAPPQKN